MAKLLLGTGYAVDPHATITAPTPVPGDNSTAVATTAFVTAAIAAGGGGGSAATIGTASLNFGVSPGGTDAKLIITGQTAILATSHVDAWIVPAATADHSVDEHWVEDLFVMAGNIVAGTGFTIYGKSPSGTYGAFNIQWTWI
jgi:hypothetical protein